MSKAKAQRPPQSSSAIYKLSGSPEESPLAGNATFAGELGNMKFEYDRVADALYICFSEQAIIDTIRVNDDIGVEFDVAERMVGVEIRNASTYPFLHWFLIDGTATQEEILRLCAKPLTKAASVSRLKPLGSR